MKFPIKISVESGFWRTAFKILFTFGAVTLFVLVPVAWLYWDQILPIYSENEAMMLTLTCISGLIKIFLSIILISISVLIAVIAKNIT